jgi:hypothetical protein
MNRRWRLAALAVVAFLAGLAVIWLSSDAQASPTLPEPPRRLSDVVCPPAPRLVRVGRGGGLEVQVLGRDGCVVGWAPWRPMVRGR